MTDCATLFGDRFAPVTSAMGFLCAPIDTVADALLEWRRRIHGTAYARPVEGGLEKNLPALEPLTAGVRPRELVVATASSEWTAIFDCGIQGGDPSTTIGYLSRTLKVQGVVVVSIPDVRARPGRADRFGARQFELFGPLPTDFLNYVRTVSVIRDGARWRFDAVGVVQDFEDVDAYTTRKIADRFTSEMLVSYTAAVGLRPFDASFFPGPCVLVTNPAVPPPGAPVMSIEDARNWAGFGSDSTTSGSAESGH